MAAEPFDECGVADAEAEQESPGVGLGEGGLCGNRREGVADPDVRHPDRDGDAFGRRENDAGECERIPEQPLTNPDRRDAELFEFGDPFADLVCVVVVEVVVP